ncbi:uncharacterized protein L969DRAFT_89669 [Mixia osmundae IAM 14324]|nr:uncharacterized protein L969DRAFT_89669 [Mixia osmundae IAM 14324]KEI37701.1 hypothetical protein L969DRAFT_89669 [Mixia osmundae IAM 14324]
MSAPAPLVGEPIVRQTSNVPTDQHEKVLASKVEHEEFIVEAVLFDMDGTLVDSIQAVEAAWGGVALELGKDPQEVIDATHGRRAIDNLRDLRPDLAKVPESKMDPHVEEFEQKILTHADQYHNEVRSRRQSAAESIRSSRSNSRKNSSISLSKPPSRKGSFASELTKRMQFTRLTEAKPVNDSSNASPIERTDSPANGSKDATSAVLDENPFDDDDDDEEIDIDALDVDVSDLIDRSCKILPGVKRLIDGLPADRYAVATSGAKTYCYGALKRIGITPPAVTVTADDKHLLRGKPHPDPFMLAAKRLGFDCKDCLVFEDSPSGIRAGVASGAKTIAVCTSHPASKIKDSGAHYLIPTIECIHITPMEDGRLKVVIDQARVKRDLAALGDKVATPEVPTPARPSSAAANAST